MTAPHSHAGSPGSGQFSPQPAPRMEAVLTVAPQATLHLGGRPLRPPAEAGQGRPAGCREGGSVSDRHRSRIPAPFLTSRGDEGLRLPAALLCWWARPHQALHAGRTQTSPGAAPMGTPGGAWCVHELCAG